MPTIRILLMAIVLAVLPAGSALAAPQVVQPIDHLGRARGRRRQGAARRHRDRLGGRAAVFTDQNATYWVSVYESHSSPSPTTQKFGLKSK